MRSRFSWFFMVLLFPPSTVLARGAASSGGGTGTGVRYLCQVESVLKGGSISLTRIFTGAGVFWAGDSMRWSTTGHDPQHPRRPVDFELTYLWEPDAQPEVEPREISFDVQVGVETDLPEVTLFEIQRPFPVKPYGMIGAAALTTQIFPWSSANLRNGHGEIPLGDLLAYAEGYSALDWRLVRPSDRLNGGTVLAAGKLDIDSLREAMAALPGLRTALLPKIARPKQCDRQIWPDLVTP